jgi:HK97 gp10 family phage protein
MEVSTSVQFEEVSKKLQEMGVKLARRALKQALRPVGQMLVEETQSRVPVDKGDLRESIAAKMTSKGSEKKGVIATVTVGPMFGIGERKPGNGSQQPAIYGMFEEFGTSKTKPQPFLRPTFDAASGKAVDLFALHLLNNLNLLVED